MWDTAVNAGKVNCRCDTAFACLDLGDNDESGSSHDDLLVVVGDGSDGGLYTVKAREGPQPIQTLPCWSPMTDLVTDQGELGHLEEENVARQGKNPKRKRERVFACAGRGDQGAVTELRYGLEAQIGSTLQSPDFANVMSIWAFPNEKSGLNLLMSFPETSEVLEYVIDTKSGEGLVPLQQAGLDLEAPTLAAGLFDDYTLQITSDGIQITSLNRVKPAYRNHVSGGKKMIHAAAVRGDLGIFVIITQKDALYELQLWKVATSLKEGVTVNAIGKALKLLHPATCLCIVDHRTWDNASYVVLSTAPGVLTLFAINVQSGLVQVLTEQIDERGDEQSLDFTYACESIALISSSRTGEVTLLCGLRNGHLVPFKVVVELGSTSISKMFFVAEAKTPADPSIEIGLTQGETLPLGDTSVKINAEGTNAGTALVTCLEVFCRVGYTDETGQLSLSIHEIFLSDVKEVSHFDTPVTSSMLISHSLAIDSPRSMLLRLLSKAFRL